MSTGKLKAQYNRVRTSTALHTTSIWSNTIGLQQEQAGTNQAIEASIYAPGGAGGGGRAAKRQRAQELIEASGYQPSVRDFEGLKALARRQGGDAATNRGACKICGGLGHLTKQCRNFLDNGNGKGGAAGSSAAAAAADGGERQLLTADDDDALLLQSDSMGSSELGSDSDTGRSSDSDRKRKRKKSSSKKHKKEKSKKHKKEKHKKHKSSRDRSRSRSRDRSGRDRSRSRSPARRH